MTSAIPGSGFRIATGFLKIVADDAAARRDTDRFLRDTDRKFARGGEGSGKSFWGGFFKGFRTWSTRIFDPLLQLMRRTVTVTLTLTKFGLIAGVVATAIGGLASAVASLVPALAELIQVAVAASGSLLLIPGAIAALVGIVATAKLGLKGFGAALKEIGKGDVEKLNEALKRLAPNAAKVVRELQKLKPGFDRLQLRIQNTLFTGLAVQVKALGGTLLPALMGSLNGMAAVLNGVVREGLAFLLDAGTRSDLVLIFDAAARSVGNLGQAFRPLLNIIRDVTAVSALMFAQFTGGAGAAVTRWAQSIAQMRTSGALAGFITDGLEALGQFKDLLVDVFGIFHGLFNASGAGGLFSFFDRLNTLVNSVAGQGALREIFASLTEVGIALTPVLLVLLKALVPVAGGLALLSKALAPGLMQLVNGLAAGLAALAPGLGALNPLLATAGKFLPFIGTGLSKLLIALAPGLNKGLEGLGTALAVIGDAAEPLGAAIGQVFAALGPALVPLAGILSSLIISLAPGAAELINALAMALTALAPALPGIVDDLVKFIITLSPIVAQLGPVLAELLPVISQEFAELADAMLPLMPAIVKLIEVATPLLTWLLQTGIALAILPLKLAEVGEKIASWLIPKIMGGKKAVETFGNAVKEHIGDVIEFFKKLGSTIVDKLSNFGTLLKDAGRNLMKGLLSGLESMVGALKDKLSWITSLIPDWKGPLDRDKRLLYGAGQATMQGYIGGLASQLPNLAGLLGSVTANVPAMANAGATSTGGTASTSAAARTGYFGPYEMHVDGDVFHRFVIDAVTGNPVDVARAVDEGQRQRGYRDSSRKRIGTRR